MVRARDLSTTDAATGTRYRQRRSNRTKRRQELRSTAPRAVRGRGPRVEAGSGLDSTDRYASTRPFRLVGFASQPPSPEGKERGGIENGRRKGKGCVPVGAQHGCSGSRRGESNLLRVGVGRGAWRTAAVGCEPGRRDWRSGALRVGCEGCVPVGAQHGCSGSRRGESNLLRVGVGRGAWRTAAVGCEPGRRDWRSGVLRVGCEGCVPVGAQHGCSRAGRGIEPSPGWCGSGAWRAAVGCEPGRRDWRSGALRGTREGCVPVGAQHVQGAGEGNRTFSGLVWVGGLGARRRLVASRGAGTGGRAL